MNWIKLTALFVCTILGAGFATGRELFIYFVSFGIWGFLGIIISSVIFALAAYKTLSGNYNNINDVFPYPLNILFSLITFLFLIVLYSAMLSAAGELFKNIFNIPYIFGVFAIALISQLSISRGSNGITNLSLILCPIMLSIAVIVSIYILNKSSTPTIKINFNHNCIYSAIIYPAYNIITALTVLKTNTKKSTAIKTAVASGIIIGILAISLSLPLLYNYDLIINKPLPLLWLLPKGNIITILYIVMLVSAIITTAVSNGYSAAKQLMAFCMYYKKNIAIKIFTPNKSSIYITLSAMLISFLGFDAIVGKLYFFFGMFGVLLLANLFFIKKGSR